MTRKKVKLAFIQNDSARKATFKKRRKGIIKKVEELSTLCGVDACAIVYSPYESHPETWPHPILVQGVLSEFRKMSEIDQSKKMVNQESFLKQRISKALDQVRKVQKDSREMEISHVMNQSLLGRVFEYLSTTDLTDLCWMAEQRLKSVYHHIHVLTRSAISSQPIVPVLEPAADHVAAPAAFDPNNAAQIRLSDADQMAARQQLGAGPVAPFEGYNNNMAAGANMGNGNNMAGASSNGDDLWSNNNYFPWA